MMDATGKLLTEKSQEQRAAQLRVEIAAAFKTMYCTMADISLKSLTKMG
jgi:hypothetical protein